MQKLILTFLSCLFLLNTVECKSYRYELSACAIFQDEADYLKEWIEFHKLVGVQHFYLYDNESTDHFQEVLSPYIESGEVELFYYPGGKQGDWTPTQLNAYNHCLKHCKGKTRWLAVIDIDEFLFPVKTNSLVAFLKKYENYGGLVAFWQMYGTSNVKKIQDSELLIEKLNWKYPKDQPVNRHVKSIVHPHRVKKFATNSHRAKYKKAYFDVTPNGKGGNFQPIQIDEIRINHYWYRDEDYFYNVKIPRRARVGDPCVAAKNPGEMALSNSHEDKVIHKYVPALQKAMEKNNQ